MQGWSQAVHLPDSSTLPFVTPFLAVWALILAVASRSQALLPRRENCLNQLPLVCAFKLVEVAADILGSEVI